MADKFQNGLYLLSPDGNYIGQVMARWIVEFCVQIVGMTLYDSAVTAGSWTATIATGADGASVVGHPEQFSAVSRTWTSADVGRYITITGMIGGNLAKNGIYRISKFISASVVELEIQRSIHEDGIPIGLSSLNWRLWDGTSSYRPAAASGNWAVLVGTYGDATNFHVKIDVNTDSQRMPSLSIGPWATWNNGTHAWSDTRNTTVRSVANWSTGNAVNVFATGDINRVLWGWYYKGTSTSAYWGFSYFGEFTPSYGTVIDPKPACTISGGESTTNYALGAGRSTSSDAFGQGLRFLSSDSTTVISGYSEFPNIYSHDASNVNRMKGQQRKWSQWSRKMYRFELLVTSRTTGKFERRGVLKGLWATGQDYPRAMPFGASREYLHFGYGLAMPWNGSKVHVQVP